EGVGRCDRHRVPLGAAAESGLRGHQRRRQPGDARQGVRECASPRLHPAYDPSGLALAEPRRARSVRRGHLPRQLVHAPASRAGAPQGARRVLRDVASQGHSDCRPAQLRCAARQADRAVSQVLLLRRERLRDARVRGRHARAVPVCVQRRLDVPPEHVPAAQGLHAAAAEGGGLPDRHHVRRFPGNLPGAGTRLLRARRGEGIQARGGGRVVNAAHEVAVRTAQTYYDSDDADNFYYHVWGGEDIHIGLYESATEDIRTASRRTVEALAGKLANLRPGARVLDAGAGYGGAARLLAERSGAQVVCLNLSEAQNERNREFTRAAGLADRIDVQQGSFERIPFGEREFDVVWSQDSFLHSAARETVLREIDRVLKPGGEVIFTDPMQADDCPPGVLAPVLERLHLESLGSFAFYRRT